MRFSAMRTALAVAATLAVAAPVFAIVGGTFDADNGYANVCSIAFTKQPQNVPGQLTLPQTFSTGTLVHPRVVLTAGHTVTGLRSRIHANDNIKLSDIVVMFDPDVHTPGAAQHAIESMDIHPKFTGRNADSIDIGVIVLTDPVVGITPVTLPDADFLEDLDLDRGPSDTKPTFTIVGYGTTMVPKTVPENPPGERRYATSTFKSLRTKYLMTSQNFTLGEGGLSRGDSGGAAFWTESDGTRVQVGVTVAGDAASVSYGSSVRTDIAIVLDFINDAIDGLDN
jgi:secreted trypsin-like serine protease